MKISLLINISFVRKRKHQDFKKREAKGGTAVQDDDVQDADQDIDFAKVDFSQYKGGAKKGRENNKEFNPWKDYDKKGKSSKAKQSYKPAAGKSMSYKK